MWKGKRSIPTGLSEEGEKEKEFCSAAGIVEDEEFGGLKEGGGGRGRGGYGGSGGSAGGAGGAEGA